MKKQTLLNDDYQMRDVIVQRRRQDIGKKNTHQKGKEPTGTMVVCNKEDMGERMRNQKQKDKQLLQEWKRIRNTEKRANAILLLQSRQVKEISKLCSVKVFDEYEEHEGTCVCKYEDWMDEEY